MCDCKVNEKNKGPPGGIHITDNQTPQERADIVLKISVYFSNENCNQIAKKCINKLSLMSSRYLKDICAPDGLSIGFGVKLSDTSIQAREYNTLDGSICGLIDIKSNANINVLFSMQGQHVYDNESIQKITKIQKEISESFAKFQYLYTSYFVSELMRHLKKSEVCSSFVDNYEVMYLIKQTS